MIDKPREPKPPKEPKDQGEGMPIPRTPNSKSVGKFYGDPEDLKKHINY